MQTTWSASWAPRLPRSASETASTDSIPSSKQALTIRTAISPRLAIRTRRSAISGPPTHPSGSTTTIGCPNSTAAPFSTRIAVTTPSTGEATWFISFITSTIATVSPAATGPPTSTNGGAPGAGARQNRPTDGESIFVPFSGTAVAVAGAGAVATPSVAGAGTAGADGTGAGVGAAGAVAWSGSGSRETWRRSSPTSTTISRQSLRSKASSSALIVSGLISMRGDLLGRERG